MPKEINFLQNDSYEKLKIYIWYKLSYIQRTFRCDIFSSSEPNVFTDSTETKFSTPLSRQPKVTVTEYCVYN